jgi:pimeloyl-ACP methyl ester carboxylesterase
MIGAAQKGHPGISAPEALAPIIALLDKIGNAILVTHSQGGDLGWQVAIACPDKVAAIVAVEPARTAPGLSDPRFPDIPVRIVWGDNIPAESPVLSQSDVAEGVNIAAERPSVSVDVLPESGIFGNGHMMMMEDNNVEIAKRIMMWLRAKLP